MGNRTEDWRNKAVTLEFVSTPNVVVRALAGTGKTTTFKWSVHKLHYEPVPKEFIPSEEQQAIWDEIMKDRNPGKIHMTSFSTDATEQLAAGLPDGVTASSTYGMGLSCAKQAGMAGKVDRGDWKYGRILTDFNAGNWEADKRWTGLRRDLLSLCGKARLELYRQVNAEQLNDLADHYGIDIPSSGRDMFLEAINHMLAEGLRQVGEFDYVDMVWIPNLLGLIPKRYDLMFVDEYQDMGKAQQEICYRIARKIVAIGDPNQAIYGFIGADADATESFKRSLGRMSRGVVEYPLTYTRRCPNAVVAEANKIVPDLKALPNAPDGKISRIGTWEFDLKSITPRDMIICPTNAPLVSLLFKLTKAGMKAYVRKSDIVDSMIQYVKTHTKGIEELRTSIQRMLDQTEGKTTRKAQTQRDKYSCLKEIADECHTVDMAVVTINKMFANEDRPGATRLSSVHRSKGLEAHRVIFWEWDRCGAYAELPWEIVQSRNLQYVGITRAKHELVLARS